LSIEDQVNDHGFELELDIVKFREDSDRVILNGFLGNELDVEYEESILKIIGNEGSFKIYLEEEKINQNQRKR